MRFNKYDSQGHKSPLTRHGIIYKKSKHLGKVFLN